jgi:hypothetical protein
VPLSPNYLLKNGTHATCSEIAEPPFRDNANVKMNLLPIAEDGLADERVTKAHTAAGLMGATPPCQAVMIAFEAVRHGSISRMTSG